MSKQKPSKIQKEEDSGAEEEVLSEQCDEIENKKIVEVKSGPCQSIQASGKNCTKAGKFVFDGKYTCGLHAKKFLKGMNEEKKKEYLVNKRPKQKKISFLERINEDMKDPKFCCLKLTGNYPCRNKSAYRANGKFFCSYHIGFHPHRRVAMALKNKDVDLNDLDDKLTTLVEVVGKLQIQLDYLLKHEDFRRTIYNIVEKDKNYKVTDEEKSDMKDPVLIIPKTEEVIHPLDIDISSDEKTVSKTPEIGVSVSKIRKAYEK